MQSFVSPLQEKTKKTRIALVEALDILTKSKEISMTEEDEHYLKRFKKAFHNSNIFYFPYYDFNRMTKTLDRYHYVLSEYEIVLYEQILNEYAIHAYDPKCQKVVANLLREEYSMLVRRYQYYNEFKENANYNIYKTKSLPSNIVFTSRAKAAWERGSVSQGYAGCIYPDKDKRDQWLLDVIPAFNGIQTEEHKATMVDKHGIRYRDDECVYSEEKRGGSTGIVHKKLEQVYGLEGIEPILGFGAKKGLEDNGLKGMQFYVKSGFFNVPNINRNPEAIMCLWFEVDGNFSVIKDESYSNFFMGRLLPVGVAKLIANALLNELSNLPRYEHQEIIKNWIQAENHFELYQYPWDKIRNDPYKKCAYLVKTIVFALGIGLNNPGMPYIDEVLYFLDLNCKRILKLEYPELNKSEIQQKVYDLRKKYLLGQVVDTIKPIRLLIESNKISALKYLYQLMKEPLDELVNTPDYLNDTPLMIATREKNDEVVSFLLESKASIVQKDTLETGGLNKFKRVGGSLVKRKKNMDTLSSPVDTPSNDSGNFSTIDCASDSFARSSNPHLQFDIHSSFSLGVLSKAKKEYLMEKSIRKIEEVDSSQSIFPAEQRPLMDELLAKLKSKSLGSGVYKEKFILKEEEHEINFQIGARGQVQKIFRSRTESDFPRYSVIMAEKDKSQTWYVMSHSTIGKGGYGYVKLVQTYYPSALDQYPFYAAKVEIDREKTSIESEALEQLARLRGESARLKEIDDQLTTKSIIIRDLIAGKSLTRKSFALMEVDERLNFMVSAYNELLTWHSHTPALLHNDIAVENFIWNSADNKATLIDCGLVTRAFSALELKEMKAEKIKKLIKDDDFYFSPFQAGVKYNIAALPKDHPGGFTRVTDLYGFILMLEKNMASLAQSEEAEKALTAILANAKEKRTYAECKRACDEAITFISRLPLETILMELEKHRAETQSHSPRMFSVPDETRTTINTIKKLLSQSTLDESSLQTIKGMIETFSTREGSASIPTKIFTEFNRWIDIEIEKAHAGTPVPAMRSVG